MNLGIMAMQMEALVPTGLPPEQVMASLIGFDHASLVGSLADQGFNPIELGGDLGMFLPQSFNQEAITNLAALKREKGIDYTVHLPLWSVEPSTPLSPVRAGSVQAVVDIISATRELDPLVYVLHATGALAAEFFRMNISDTARALILRQFQAGARASLQEILARTGIPGRKLAIETIEFPFDLTLELAEELYLSICFDTGHILANFAGELDFFEALERCLPRMAEVHLHDCPRMLPGQIGYGADHKPLGTGGLELDKFLQRLIGHGFNGPIVFELQVQEALDSRRVVLSKLP